MVIISGWWFHVYGATNHQAENHQGGFSVKKRSTICGSCIFPRQRLDGSCILLRGSQQKNVGKTLFWLDALTDTRTEVLFYTFWSWRVGKDLSKWTNQGRQRVWNKVTFNFQIPIALTLLSDFRQSHPRFAAPWKMTLLHRVAERCGSHIWAQESRMNPVGAVLWGDPLGLINPWGTAEREVHRFKRRVTAFSANSS